MSDVANRTLLALVCVIATILCAPVSASAQSEERRVMQAYRHEPPVRDVQRAALRATGLESAPEHGWAARARWSHVLPEVRGEVAWLDQRDIEFSYREDIETETDGIVTESRNDYVDDARLRGVYAVRLEWDLSGLIFDSDELKAARASERRHIARAELLQMVTDIYYERRRWQVELALTPRSHVRPRIEARLQVESATAKLDAFTNGWFSGRLEQSQRARAGGRP